MQSLQPQDRIRDIIVALGRQIVQNEVINDEHIEVLEDGGCYYFMISPPRSNAPDGVSLSHQDVGSHTALAALLFTLDGCTKDGERSLTIAGEEITGVITDYSAFVAAGEERLAKFARVQDEAARRGAFLNALQQSVSPYAEALNGIINDAFAALGEKNAFGHVRSFLLGIDFRTGEGHPHLPAARLFFEISGLPASYRTSSSAVIYYCPHEEIFSPSDYTREQAAAGAKGILGAIRIFAEAARIEFDAHVIENAEQAITQLERGASRE